MHLQMSPHEIRYIYKAISQGSCQAPAPAEKPHGGRALVLGRGAAPPQQSGGCRRGRGLCTSSPSATSSLPSESSPSQDPPRQ